MAGGRSRIHMTGGFDAMKERKMANMRRVIEKNNRRAKSLNDYQITKLSETIERLKQNEESSRVYYDKLAHKYSYNNMVRLTAAQEDTNTKAFRARYVARSYPIQQALIIQSIEVERNVRKLDVKMKYIESVRAGESSDGSCDGQRNETRLTRATNEPDHT